MVFDREESFDLAEEVLRALNRGFDDITNNHGNAGFHNASYVASEVSLDESSNGSSVVEHVFHPQNDLGNVDDTMTTTRLMSTSDQENYLADKEQLPRGESAPWTNPPRYYLRDQREYFQPQEQPQMTDDILQANEIQPNIKQENAEPYSPVSEGIATTSTRSAKSAQTAGKVGRKPPKGPDGSVRYSKRRSTEDRRERVNMRERDRMHQLSEAFELLRRVLPYNALEDHHVRTRGQRLQRYPIRQKMSKVDTLLLAKNYILALQDMCKNSAEAQPIEQHHHQQAAGTSSCKYL